MIVLGKEGEVKTWEEDRVREPRSTTAQAKAPEPTRDAAAARNRRRRGRDDDSHPNRVLGQQHDGMEADAC